MQTISGVIGDDSGSAAAAGYSNAHANYNPGNAGLIKTGIGTLTLSAVNTYTGTTAVIALGFVVATAAIAILVNGVEKERTRVVAPAE